MRKIFGLQLTGAQLGVKNLKLWRNAVTSPKARLLRWLVIDFRLNGGKAGKTSGMLETTLFYIALNMSGYSSTSHTAWSYQDYIWLHGFVVLLGTWNGSTQPADQSNVVYGSRDIMGRINRRASRRTI